MDTVMYKVLIADDEYWTREKIRNMIEWEKYSLQFMEPAVDGEDVLRKLQAEQPDILITDINMPFVNGVELLKIIQERYPDIVTFVISGYDDFQYVKEAFIAGSINYLLKPVTKIDLVNALSKALIIISRRKSLQEQENQQRENLLRAASLIQDREFSLLLEREEAPFTPTITMNSDIDFAGASLMLIKIHSLKALAEEYRYDMNRLSFAVKKETEGLIDSEGSLIFNHIYRSNEFIVVSELDNQELKRRGQKLLVYLSNHAKSPVTICISEHTYTMDSIHMAYVQAVALLMNRGYRPGNELLVSDNGNMKDSIQNRLTEEKEKQMKSLLGAGKLEGLKELIFETVGLAHCQEDRWGYLEVKQTVKKIVNVLSEFAVGYMQPGEVVAVESMGEQADKTIELLDNTALCSVLGDMMEYVMPDVKKTSTDSIRDAVKQAVEYINSHYFEELSLTSLAEQFNVESSYFSKIFRQETGETVMVYITRLRIEKAQEYMKKQEISLTEIAFLVGYDDYTYFSRVFRKMVGKSPRDYRGGMMLEKK